MLHPRPTFTEILAHRTLRSEKLLSLAGVVMVTRPVSHEDDQFYVALEAQNDHSVQELAALAASLESIKEMDESTHTPKPRVTTVEFTEDAKEAIENGLDLRVADAIMTHEVVLELVQVLGAENVHALAA